MRIILQRVRSSEVRVEGECVGRIGLGLLVLVGIEEGDTDAAITKAAEKLHHVRIFRDGAGRMNLAAHQVDGAFLIVSQFTLAGSLRKGRRPSFDRAADPEVAEPLVRRLAKELERYGNPVEQGVFGADMEVDLVNDGPVTFILEL